MTPEEVADSIIGSMGMAVSRSPEDRQWLIGKITAFADERVKEFIIEAFDHDPRLAQAKKKIRAEALEEAAKVVEDRAFESGVYTEAKLLEQLAIKIRSLQEG